MILLLGARIKNEPVEMQQKILSLKLDNEQRAEIQREITQRLIISYTESGAKKDNYNRTNGMERLKKQLKKGKLPKSISAIKAITTT